MNRLSEKQMVNLINYLKLNKFEGTGRAEIAKIATKDLRYKVNTNNIIRAQKRAGLTPIQVGRPSKKEFIGPPKPSKYALNKAIEHAKKQSDAAWSKYFTKDEMEQIDKEGQKLLNQYVSSFEVQVGGDHYSKMVIQPIEYILKNNLGYCEANVVKYISRWKDKNGVEDLEKAKHYIDMLISQQPR